MLYYILTQGTKSSENSFILNNGEIVFSDDKSRDRILNEFKIFDSKSKLLYSKDQEIVIKKNRNNFLIEALTTNTDRVGRKIPVELLLKDYSTKTSLPNELLKINSLLQDENIILDQKLWLSIPSLIAQSLKNYHRNKKIKILLTVTALAIIIVLLISMLYEYKYLE